MIKILIIFLLFFYFDLAMAKLKIDASWIKRMPTTMQNDSKIQKLNQLRPTIAIAIAIGIKAIVKFATNTQNKDDIDNFNTDKKKFCNFKNFCIRAIGGLFSGTALSDQLDPSYAMHADMKCFLKTVENLEIESTDNVCEFIEEFKKFNEEGFLLQSLGQQIGVQIAANLKTNGLRSIPKLLKCYFIAIGCNRNVVSLVRDVCLWHYLKKTTIEFDSKKIQLLRDNATLRRVQEVLFNGEAAELAFSPHERKYKSVKFLLKLIDDNALSKFSEKLKEISTLFEQLNMDDYTFLRVVRGDISLKTKNVECNVAIVWRFLDNVRIAVKSLSYEPKTRAERKLFKSNAFKSNEIKASADFLPINNTVSQHLFQRQSTTFLNQFYTKPKIQIAKHSVSDGFFFLGIRSVHIAVEKAKFRQKMKSHKAKNKRHSTKPTNNVILPRYQIGDWSKSALISNIASSNDLQKILKSFNSLPTATTDVPQTMSGRLFRLAYSTSADSSLNDHAMADHSPDVLIAAMFKYMSSLGVDLLSCDPGKGVSWLRVQLSANDQAKFEKYDLNKYHKRFFQMTNPNDKTDVHDDRFHQIHNKKKLDNDLARSMVGRKTLLLLGDNYSSGPYWSYLKNLLSFDNVIVLFVDEYLSSQLHNKCLQLMSNLYGQKNAIVHQACLEALQEKNPRWKEVNGNNDNDAGGTTSMADNSIQVNDIETDDDSDDFEDSDESDDESADEQITDEKVIDNKLVDDNDDDEKIEVNEKDKDLNVSSLETNETGCYEKELYDACKKLVYPKKTPIKMNENDRRDLRSRLLNKEKEEICRRDPTAGITEIENYCVVTSHNGARASRRVGRPLKNDEYVVDFNAFLKEEDQLKVDNLIQKLGTDGIPCLNNEQIKKLNDEATAKKKLKLKEEAQAVNKNDDNSIQPQSTQSIVGKRKRNEDVNAGECDDGIETSNNSLSKMTVDDDVAVAKLTQQNVENQKKHRRSRHIDRLEKQKYQRSLLMPDGVDRLVNARAQFKAPLHSLSLRRLARRYMRRCAKERRRCVNCTDQSRCVDCSTKSLLNKHNKCLHCKEAIEAEHEWTKVTAKQKLWRNKRCDMCKVAVHRDINACKNLLYIFACCLFFGARCAPFCKPQSKSPASDSAPPS